MILCLPSFFIGDLPGVWLKLFLSALYLAFVFLSTSGEKLYLSSKLYFFGGEKLL